MNFITSQMYIMWMQNWMLLNPKQYDFGDDYVIVFHE